MTPEVSSEHQNQPVLCESPIPVFVRAFAFVPEQLRRGMLAAFRQQLVSVLNGESRQSTEANPNTEVKDLIEAVQLGASYVHYKKAEKGGNPDQGLSTYLTAEQFPQLAAIGKKVKEEFYNKAKNRIERNRNIGKGRKLSGLLDNLIDIGNLAWDSSDLPFPRHFSLHEFMELYRSGSFTDWSQLAEFGEGLKHIEGMLGLSKFLKIKNREIEEHHGNLQSGLKHLLSRCEHIGILEVAVFCAVFKQRHDLRSTSTVTLEKTDARLFFAGIERENRGYNYREGEMEAYHTACQSVFGEEAERAWPLLRHYLIEVVSVLNIAAEGEVESIEEQHYELFFPVDRIDADTFARASRTDEKRSEKNPEDHFIHQNIDGILRLPRNEFAALIIDHSRPEDWISLLKKDNSTDQLSALLNRMTEVKEGKELCGQIFIMLLSFEPVLFAPSLEEEPRSISELLMKNGGPKIRDNEELFAIKVYQNLENAAQLAVRSALQSYRDRNFVEIFQELFPAATLSSDLWHPYHKGFEDIARETNDDSTHLLTLIDFQDARFERAVKHVRAVVPTVSEWSEILLYYSSPERKEFFRIIERHLTPEMIGEAFEWMLIFDCGPQLTHQDLNKKGLDLLEEDEEFEEEERVIRVNPTYSTFTNRKKRSIVINPLWERAQPFFDALSKQNQKLLYDRFVKKSKQTFSDEWGEQMDNDIFVTLDMMKLKK